MIGYFSVGDVSDDYNLVYPNLTIFCDDWEDPYCHFGCTEKIYNKQITKDFISKYKTYLQQGSFPYGTNVNYMWSNL